MKSLTKLHEKRTVLSFSFLWTHMPQQVELIIFNDQDEMWCTEKLISIFTLLNANKVGLPWLRLPTDQKRIHYAEGDNSGFFLLFAVLEKLNENFFLWILCNCHWGYKSKSDGLNIWNENSGNTASFCICFLCFLKERWRRSKDVKNVEQGFCGFRQRLYWIICFFLNFSSKLIKHR